jgi:nitrilase
MKAAAVQFAPVFLDTPRTLERMLARIAEARALGADLVAFPETALSGYPTWLARTGGAAFDDPAQKRCHAAYLDCAVEAGGPELTALAEAARDLDVYLVAGLVERGSGRGRGSTWASLLRVSREHPPILHRKLVPTHEERLAWAPGDAQGLCVRRHRGFGIGALNCWENWMPLARAALYEQGLEVQVQAWPGSPALTRDNARFVALEGRVYVVASSGVLRGRDIPADFPLREALVADEDQVLHSGGSRILAPDGTELAALDEPVEGIVSADLDLARLRGERQNFDPAGHYSRPELLRLEIDRRRF